ncbi:RNA demethylase ALKBH10B-like [Primulina tabacum]|uniref:RNA demethylase ALKBH10B-like n=1 Tax=Primulina tabacum TaxID=48773 RepID=UPI003F5A8E39
MPPVAAVLAQGDRIQLNPMMAPAVVQQLPPPGVMMTTVSETFAKDAIISWFRGEFAAANAIIDTLCSHLTQLESGGAAEYKSVFAAIHMRRMNWIPILHRQKYFSIADIPMELNKVAAKKVEERNVACTESCDEKVKNQEIPAEESAGIIENDGGEAAREESERDESPESEITDTGSQEVQPSLEHVDICSNHEDCDARCAQIKMTKGFIAKEPVKGHMVNVVRGLKLYEDVFTDVELSKLNNLVNELRIAGQNGELSDETFVLYNQHVKGNKRELIQLGVPIFGKIHNDSMTQKNYVDPIPTLLQGVIEHLIQWHLIPEHRKPNSCIINFFDEGEYSQPFLKPPHLDQPLSTLLLSESTMAFGRTVVNDGEGNYRGPLMLSLKEGSLLVMRGNSSDTARHVMCASLNKRVTITFFRVRAETQNNTPAESPLNKAMTLWQPGAPNPNATLTGYEPMTMIPKWSLMRSPLVMLAPVRPMVVSPKRVPGGGTGVFLPWTVGSRKPAKHLPPRAQRGRFLSLRSSVETRKEETNSDSGLNNS